MNNSEALTSMKELIPLISESLSNGGTARISPRGTSMLPMICQGIDSVVLSSAPEKLKKYDLPLYRRDNGTFVLHRITSVGETYTCMGDNQFIPEYGIRREQVIAVVTAFYRGEKRYSTSSVCYMSYCRLWHHIRPIRKLWRRGIQWIRRHLKLHH